jgi:hypothetical protein
VAVRRVDQHTVDIENGTLKFHDRGSLLADNRSANCETGCLASLTRLDPRSRARGLADRVIDAAGAAGEREVSTTVEGCTGIT